MTRVSVSIAGDKKAEISKGLRKKRRARTPRSDLRNEQSPEGHRRLAGPASNAEPAKCVVNC